jgi:hypothetical protein
MNLSTVLARSEFEYSKIGTSKRAKSLTERGKFFIPRVEVTGVITTPPPISGDESAVEEAPKYTLVISVDKMVNDVSSTMLANFVWWGAFTPGPPPPPPPS